MTETTTLFEPTREAGLARLEERAEGLGRRYADARNHDHGPDDRTNISTLSPWITHRLVSEREVAARALKDHGKGNAEKFVSEVFWRTYFKGWLEMRPHVWSSYLSRLDRALDQADGNGGIRRDYDAAVNGTTGIEGFDDWARELIEHGYLHNHARMWFASIWIHTLRLDWTLGADFFMRHLLDGDSASNTLSWRWVAGLHTRGKAYTATASNIRKFSGGRFDPKGLNERVEPLDETDDMTPERIEPLPPLPGGKALLIVHGADCTPERLRWPRTEIVAVEGLPGTGPRSPLDVSEELRVFVRGAVEDGVRRASEHFDAASSSATEPDAIVAHAKDAGADHIVAPHAPVGHMRAALDRVRSLAREEGLSLYELRDDWDTRAWPYATKGFFGLKKHIPQLVRDAGIG